MYDEAKCRGACGNVLIRCVCVRGHSDALGEYRKAQGTFGVGMKAAWHQGVSKGKETLPG